MAGLLDLMMMQQGQQPPAASPAMPPAQPMPAQPMAPDPNQAARARGLLAPGPAPGAPPQPPPMGGAFSGPQGAQQLRQLYGTMAQFADEPQRMGEAYVRAMQYQQQLDAQDDPAERWLRMYGNINPYDFETDSLADFHEKYTQTGQMDFRLLRRKEDLSTKEQGFLNDAITKAQKAEVDMGRMIDLSNRFQELSRQGVAQGRLAGGLNEWMKGVLGSEDEVSRIRTEYEQLRISNVVGNLPPGVASDKDVALVLKGWPGGVADPAYISSFLRGMVKLKAIDHANATHGAAYLGRTRSQIGQLEDWKANQDWLIEDALRRHGGYNPPGSPTPEPPRNAPPRAPTREQQRMAPPADVPAIPGDVRSDAEIDAEYDL